MAQLTVQSIVQTGLAPVYSAASATGDTFQNTADESTFIHVKNAGAGAATVTVNPFVNTVKAAGVGNVTVSPVSVSVPATTGDRMIGPFPQYAFTDTGGNVNVAYSVVTSLTIAAIRVTPVSR